VSARRAEHRLDKNRKLQRARFSLTHATPLLPAPTQSEGECRVGEGEPKGESTGGAASPFTRSLLEPQIGLPLLLAVFYRLLVRRHGGTTWFLLRVHGPYRCLRDGYYISICGLRLLCLSCPISSNTLSFLHHFLRTTAAISRKKSTADELRARTKANSYQRGAHRGKDSLQDRNKQVGKVKKHQDMAWDRHIL
jgi:hypothetical protein